jgi:hypothetical protein
MARSRNATIDWPFVITKDPKDTKSRCHRRVVRSNAMRDFWRRKKLASKESAKLGPSHKFTDITVSTAYDDDLVLPGFLVDESERLDRVEEASVHRIGEQTGAEGSDPAAMHNDPNSTSTVAQRHVSSNGALHPLRFEPIPSLKSSLGSGVSDPFNALPVRGSQSWDVLHSRKCIPPHISSTLFPRPRVFY